jgi:hypothetical protein
MIDVAAFGAAIGVTSIKKSPAQRPWLSREQPFRFPKIRTNQ